MPFLLGYDLTLPQSQCLKMKILLLPQIELTPYSRVPGFSFFGF